MLQQFISIIIVNKYNMNRQWPSPQTNRSLSLLIGAQRYKIPNNRHSPQSNQPLSRKKQKSVFLTEHDQLEKTKVLWRKDPPRKRSSRSSRFQIILKESGSIKSWKQLERAKSKLKIQLLQRKSKEEIFEQNMRIIRKIQDTPPVIDPWNYRKAKTSRNAIERRFQKERLLEENMKIIKTIEDMPPKVDSWSYRKPKVNKILEFERKQRKEKLLSQNLKIIDKIENIPPKVESWVDLNWLRKKAERKKKAQNLYFDPQKITILLKQAQERLQKRESYEREMEAKKRYRTLPSKMASPKNKSMESDPHLKNFTAKIKGVKFGVDCWNKKKNGQKNLPTIGRLMDLKQRQKVMATQKLRPGFLKK